MNNDSFPSFRNHNLRQQALTHRSLSNHNERLEFIGDGILQGVVTSLLSQKFPQAREGELTKKRVALVRNAALANVAQNIDVGRHLKMSKHAERQGCRRSPKILSGALEALIGAYFIDSGYNFKKVERYIVSLLSPSFPGKI